MPRIYTKRQANQVRCYRRPKEIQPNTEPGPTNAEILTATIFLELGLFLADQPFPKLFDRLDVQAIAEEFCYPEDVVHAALLAMIEDGSVEYLPNGRIEFMPYERRRLEREGV